MRNKFDWMLLLPVLALVVASLATLFSISQAYFFNQLLYLCISVVAFFLFLNVQHKVLSLYAVPIYAVSVAILAFVLFLGFESRGAVRWIDIFGFRIQFSEILKPFLLVSFSWFLSKDGRRIFWLFLQSLMFLFPIFLLIFFQPDLGSALIYAGVVIWALFLFGFPKRWFIAGLSAFLVSLPVLWQFLHDYQKTRVITFFRPETDPLGTSYNAMQSLIAVGSGSVFGKGFGQGTQSVLQFLPERHTDFIFATLVESFGLLGGVFVLFCFALLLYRIIVLYMEVDDVFQKVYCIGAFLLFLIQFFVNTGMNIGLVPIVGVTLPFVSYGGSSLLSSFIILGILSSFRPKSGLRQILEIR